MQDKDIIENILMHSDMNAIENLSMINKKIRHYCQDKKIWQLIYDKNQLQLFKPIQHIQNFEQFIESYKIYNAYESQARKIINYCAVNNRSIYVDLDFFSFDVIDFHAFLYQRFNKKAWREFEHKANSISEINFDFTNQFVILCYLVDGKIEFNPMSRTFNRSLSLLTDILYFYPSIDLKIASSYGGQSFFTNSNIRIGNKNGNEPSIIKKILMHYKYASFDGITIKQLLSKL